MLPVDRLDRWRRIRHFSQTLWKHRSREYLNPLQKRKKWAAEKDLNQIGFALIREENVPFLHWKVSRVTAINRGANGVIRSVVVWTPAGEYTRAIRNLSPLLFNGNSM